MRAEPHTPARHRSPDRHVSVPRDDRHVVAEDRPAFRRPGPHHCDARRSQDPDADGRAAQRVQPGHRADQPDKAAGFPSLTGTESSYLFSALHHLPTTGDNTVYNSGYLTHDVGIAADRREGGLSSSADPPRVVSGPIHSLWPDRTVGG